MITFGSLRDLTIRLPCLAVTMSLKGSGSMLLATLARAAKGKGKFKQFYLVSNQ